MRQTGQNLHRPKVFLGIVTAVTFLAALLLPLPSQAAQRETAAPSWYTDGQVRDLVRVGDAVYIGGTFTKLVDGNGNSVQRSNLAAVHATTGAVLPWNPSANGAVFALEAAPEGWVYVGGDFHTIDGISRKRLAAVDLSGAVITDFHSDVGGRVLDLIHHNNTLIVAGELTTLAGSSRSLIGRVDADTGAVDNSWIPSVDGGSIRGIEISGDSQHLYIGGNFFTVDGQNNSAFAVRLSMTDGSLDPGWRPGLDMPVFDIETVDDAVYLAVGGLGFENNRLQKHRSSDGVELLRYLGNGDVQDLELRGDTLYIGGHFTKLLGGLPRAQLAAVDTSDDHITDFAPTVETLYGVWKVLAGPEGLWLGGDFTDVGGVTRQGFAYLATDSEPEIEGDLLLSRDQPWRYLANGSAPNGGGTTWTRADYDDGGWQTGIGEIGFGDGDEKTVTSSTDVLYARSTFTVDDPSDYDDVTLRVLADAGAAVYINGREVMRHNLPGGNLTDETIATVGKWSTNEKTWVEHHFGLGWVQAGTNTVAVEVHGAYNNPSDLSFNAEIVARKSTEPGPDPDPDPDPDPGPVTVISRASSWRYVDDGSIRGSSWRQPAFDDGGWAQGSGQFGFGDGDESTTLEAGHTAYWFRKSIELSAGATEATLWLLADDGAAVYVNGVEVVRENLAGGTIDETTRAVDSRWGDPERTFAAHSIDPSLLVAGTNVIAVSIHNVWSGNGDLSFDLGLKATLGNGNGGGGGGDGDGPIDFVDPNTTWRYLDDGSQPNGDWTSAGFTDVAWPTGAGSFGFGDGDETTVVGSGHNGYFFRTMFEAAETPDSLSLALTYDDGVAVYLNGQEVARQNLADGTITADTKALGSRWGSDETTAVVIPIDPGLIIDGTNVLAVSVHNVWNGNSDLSFAAELTANG